MNKAFFKPKYKLFIKYLRSKGYAQTPLKASYLLRLFHYFVLNYECAYSLLAYLKKYGIEVENDLKFYHVSKGDAAWHLNKVLQQKEDAARMRAGFEQGYILTLAQKRN